MTGIVRRSLALAGCLVVLAWSSALDPGSAASAAGPTVEPTPTTTASPTTTTSYKLKSSDFALTISPTRIVFGPADAGTKQEIHVVNQGQDSLTVTAQKRNFSAGVNGSLNYQESAPYSASQWVTISPTTFVLAPGATQVVTATVAVPSAPDAGDHQVAIVFLVPAGRTTANVKINRGISIPMFVTVPGPTTDTTTLSGLDAPGFATRGPVRVTATVHNTGTVHHDFRAADPLIMSAADSTTAFPDFTVMRGADRDIETMWDPPILCVCHPSVSMRNADGTIQTASIRVVVFPVLPVTAVVVLLLLALLGLRWRRGHAPQPATPDAEPGPTTTGGPADDAGSPRVEPATDGASDAGTEPPGAGERGA
jgi:P pilus assembly chaperone PapD